MDDLLINTFLMYCLDKNRYTTISRNYSVGMILLFQACLSHRSRFVSTGGDIDIVGLTTPNASKRGEHNTEVERDIRTGR